MSVVVEPSPTRPSLPQHHPPSRGVTVRAVMRHGLRERRRSVLTWGLSLGAYCASMAAIYPSIQTSIEKIAKSYPGGLKEAFGVQAMNTVEGYLHAEMFSLIVPLALGFFMIRAVASSTVGSEERGRLDTILALPISRSVLMAASYAIAALAAAAIMALTGAMTYVGGRIAGTNISLGLVAAGVIGVWPLALFSGSVAALASASLHSSRTVTGVALGTVVGMYAFDVAGRLAHGLEPIRWVSAFRYYGAPLRDGIDPAAFIGLAGAAVLLLAAATAVFEERDILH